MSDGSVRVFVCVYVRVEMTNERLGEGGRRSGRDRDGWRSDEICVQKGQAGDPAATLWQREDTDNRAALSSIGKWAALSSIDKWAALS
jgi:hypothetical protein